MSALVLAFPGAEPLAARLHERLAREGVAHLGAIAVHRFPDGERRVRIVGPVEDATVVIAAELDRPDDKLLPLWFALMTARELGARSVGLAAPYLPYMRQDRRFAAGEGVSARYFARLLSRTADWLVTVDPHLHRIHDPREVFEVPVDIVHAAPRMADWIRHHVDRPLLLGPDVESTQWVEAIAAACDAPWVALHKCRVGDQAVEITLPPLDAYEGRRPVLVDDIIASGTTMAEALRLLRDDWRAPVCLAVHAVFAPGAYQRLMAEGAAAVVTSNTIPHPSNGIDVHDLAAEAVARRLARARATVGAVPGAAGW